MLNRMLQFGLIVLVIGGGIGFYMWTKPHESIGNPNFTLTASEIVAEFDKDEAEAMKKYVGRDGNMIVVQVSGKISDVKSDTSGITLALDTGDPINGVSCVLDQFTKHPRTDFKVGDDIKLKGLVTGKLSDVVIDRCVEVQ